MIKESEGRRAAAGLGLATTPPSPESHPGALQVTCLPPPSSETFLIIRFWKSIMLFGLHITFQVTYKPSKQQVNRLSKSYGATRLASLQVTWYENVPCHQVRGWSLQVMLRCFHFILSVNSFLHSRHGVLSTPALLLHYGPSLTQLLSSPLTLCYLSSLTLHHLSSLTVCYLFPPHQVSSKCPHTLLTLPLTILHLLPFILCYISSLTNLHLPFLITYNLSS